MHDDFEDLKEYVLKKNEGMIFTGFANLEESVLAYHEGREKHFASEHIAELRPVNRYHLDYSLNITRHLLVIELFPAIYHASFTCETKNKAHKKRNLLKKALISLGLGTKSSMNLVKNLSFVFEFPYRKKQIDIDFKQDYLSVAGCRVYVRNPEKLNVLINNIVSNEIKEDMYSVFSGKREGKKLKAYNTRDLAKWHFYTKEKPEIKLTKIINSSPSQKTGAITN